jgi:hypothetical protein
MSMIPTPTFTFTAPCVGWSNEPTYNWMPPHERGFHRALQSLGIRR